MKKRTFSKLGKAVFSGILLTTMFGFNSQDLLANGQTSDGNFSVLTYNIGALPWPAYSGGTAGNPDGRVQLIGPRLNTFDIVGVQEQFSLFDELREGTRFPYFSENKHLYLGGSGIDLLSKYPMAKTQRIKFNKRPFYVAKGFSKNTVTIYPGVYVDVYNTHTGDSDSHINKQLAQISSYIQANSPADRAVIVIGDFNAYLNSDEKPKMQASLLDPNNLLDACTVYFTGITPNDKRERVDKILYRSGSDVQLILSHYECIDWAKEPGDLYFGHFTTPNGLLSDHPAVMSSFDFIVSDAKRLQSGDKHYLSEMKLDYGYNNGFDHGPFGINQSIGDGNEWDGSPLHMNGIIYSKGLGAHAHAHIKINIDKKYSTFHAKVGLDEETGTRGMVRFRVFADGSEIYNSGAMSCGTPTKTISLDVSNVDLLDLRLDPEGSDSWDHGDWADAYLILK